MCSRLCSRAFPSVSAWVGGFWTPSYVGCVPSPGPRGDMGAPFLSWSPGETPGDPQETHEYPPPGDPRRSAQVTCRGPPGGPPGDPPGGSPWGIPWGTPWGIALILQGDPPGESPYPQGETPGGNPPRPNSEVQRTPGGLPRLCSRLCSRAFPSVSAWVGGFWTPSYVGCVPSPGPRGDMGAPFLSWSPGETPGDPQETHEYPPPGDPRRSAQVTCRGPPGGPPGDPPGGAA